MDLQQQIRSIIAEQLGLDVDRLHSYVYFRSLPDVTSMKILQVILEVERTFDIELDDEVTFRVETIGQFVDEVRRLSTRRLAPEDAE
jgi:acyl carrier protein